MIDFREPLQIGSFEIPNRVLLAPLAAVSDVPFRRICQEFGAGLSYVEMLSSEAILRDSGKTFRMMARHESEARLGVQLTGPNAASVASAAVVLDEHGYETIDVNMGCPVRKIVGCGAGSAILQEPERVTDTLRALGERIRVPFSAKIRLGFTRDAVNVDEISRRVSEAGASMLTIHGRTRSEDYSTGVDLDGVRLGRESARQAREIPVVGNGDVLDYASAKRMAEETGCDAVMVSRGALGNPWIFREILDARAPKVRLDEWLEVVLRHLSYHLDHYGSGERAAILTRKHLRWYAKGFPGTRVLRHELNEVSSIPQAREIVTRFAEARSPDLVRYENLYDATTDPKWDMDRKLDRGVGDDAMVANRSASG